MGYEKDISYESIKFCLENKINVITANKALLANYGNELISIAEKNKSNLLFEASVAGAIPIINVLKTLLVSNNIIKILGILNGTTNYILSKMQNDKIPFSEALSDAKNKGYVEANPDLDLKGIDSAHKLSILSSLTFKSRFSKLSNIYREGISDINIIDIDFADKFDLVIKLISTVEHNKNKLIQYVKPMMIDKNSQLGKVNGVLNGIQITSEKIGNIFLEGQGAGGYATASSIISDIYEICNKKYSPILGIDFDKLKLIENANIEDQFSSFYIRLNVLDKKGVLAEITSLFKDNNVSIETMIQNPDNFSRENDSIPLLIVTHETYLKNINNLINKIANLDNVLDKPFVIQIYKV